MDPQINLYVQREFYKNIEKVVITHILQITCSFNSCDYNSMVNEIIKLNNKLAEFEHSIARSDAGGPEHKANLERLENCHEIVENAFENIIHYQLECRSRDFFKFAYELRICDSFKDNSLTLQILKYVKDDLFKQIVLANYWQGGRMHFDKVCSFQLATGEFFQHKLHYHSDLNPYVTQYRLDS